MKIYDKSEVEVCSIAGSCTQAGLLCPTCPCESC